jgi:hypothetical protein
MSQRGRLASGIALGLACLAVACSAKTSSPAPSDPPLPLPGKEVPQRPPAFVVGGFSIDLASKALAPVAVQPGKEEFPCYIFPLEVTGTSRIVGGGKLTPAAGMHHGNITTRPRTGDGIRPCPADDPKQLFGGEAADILAGGSVLFASSTQIAKAEYRTFPDGMGFRLKEGFEIVARMHYLNTTPQPISVAPRYEWYTIDEAKLTREIFPFIWQLSSFSIPPRTDYTGTATCTFPKGMQVVNVLPHMHALGVAMDATYMGGPKDGQKFLASKGYDPGSGVQVGYDPALDLSGADGVRFGCTWKNNTDQTIVEGVGQNEMCMIFGYAWPQKFAYTLKASPSLEPGRCAYISPP